MASSKVVQSVALVLCLNLLFFNMASATTCNAVLDLSACAVVLGIPILSTGPPCCTCFSGLVALEAAACLCNYCKTLPLGVGSLLDLTASVTAVLGGCGIALPSGYQCL